MIFVEEVKKDIIEEQKRTIDNLIKEINEVKAENYNIKLENGKLKEILSNQGNTNWLLREIEVIMKDFNKIKQENNYLQGKLEEKNE